MRHPTKVLFIDTAKKIIIEHTVASLEDMQKLVGGLIERAVCFDNDDELYINEEGLFDESTDFFIVEIPGEPDRLYRGNGFVLGPPNKFGNSTDVEMKLMDLYNMIYFKSKDDIIVE